VKKSAFFCYDVFWTIEQKKRRSVSGKRVVRERGAFWGFSNDLSVFLWDFECFQLSKKYLN